MIPYNIIKCCFTYISGHAGKMVEALIIFCSTRRFHGWKCVVNLNCNKACVNHCVFGRARVYIKSFNVKICLAGIEIFILNFAFCVTVNCIGVFGTKLFYVKMLSSPANFFIRCECHTYCSMRYIVFLQMFYHSQDFSNTCFVISAKNSASVRRDNCASFKSTKMREIMHRQSYPGRKCK